MEVLKFNEKLIQEMGLDESYCAEYAKAVQFENAQDLEEAMKLFFIAGNLANEESKIWQEIASDMEADACREAILELCLFLRDEASKFIIKSNVLMSQIGISQGNAKSFNLLGTYYLKGKGVPKDYSKAINLYLQAAEKGDSSAMYNLGNCNLYGIGTEMNPIEAFKWFAEAFKNGSVSAIRQLASIYMSGSCVPQDKPKAVSLYKLASEKGDVKAMFRLGFCYLNGEGVEKSDAEAFKWCELAAKNEDLDALISLGTCYEKGIGVPQNYATAFEIFMQANETKIGDSSYYVGNCYFKGQGIEKNYINAFKFYLEAVDEGSFEISNEAMLKLSKIYEEINDKLLKEEIKQFILSMQKAADEGSLFSMYFLGLCFDNGLFEMQQDKSEAIILYWKASIGGHKNATFKLKDSEKEVEVQTLKLARDYLRGFEAPEDHRIAAKYLLEAAKKGHSEAMFALGALHEMGDGVIKDDEAAKTWYRKAEEAKALENLNIDNFDYYLDDFISEFEE